METLKILKKKHSSFGIDQTNLKEQKIRTRRLAAIMFTDIVGYTDMIGDDEAKALRILEENRRIQRASIERHGGKWIKEMGDGILSSFNTAAEAIRSALDIQQDVQKISGLRLYIGIHFSEVVFLGDDVFGLGVNIASRIQGLALPGRIWISESAANTANNKKEFHLKFVGKLNLKNVTEPVTIYETNGVPLQETGS